jgi:cysteine desulfurase/selenocysteine lyase
VLQNDFNLHSNVSYLDHASSSQTPLAVIEVMEDYYQNYRANVGRGVYSYAEKTTYAYESAREVIANFVGASSHELVMTYGATDSLNMLSHALMCHVLKPGQVILVSIFEHHSNLVPWQALAKEKGCQIIAIPTHGFDICWQSLEALLSQHSVGMIAHTHMSNVTGQVFDIARLCQMAKGIPVIVDGTQATAHLAIDVKALGCAAYAWSSHKMYGPTGVGALYIDQQYWPMVRPYRYGGGMIESVYVTHSSYKKGPHMLEAGTPAIASVIGFAKACQLLKSWDVNVIHQHEVALVNAFKDKLSEFPVKTYSAANATVLSFSYTGAHAHDVATILASHQVMVRSGHHCCMPLMQHFSENALTRISVGCYNQTKDLHQFFDALATVETTLQL